MAPCRLKHALARLACMARARTCTTQRAADPARAGFVPAWPGEQRFGSVCFSRCCQSWPRPHDGRQASARRTRSWFQSSGSRAMTHTHTHCALRSFYLDNHHHHRSSARNITSQVAKHNLPTQDLAPFPVRRVENRTNTVPCHPPSLLPLARFSSLPVHQP